MAKVKLLYLTIALIVLSACSKKATPTSSTSNKVDENIDPYLPRYEIKAPPSQEPKANKASSYSEPKESDNKALEEKLALVREKNKNIKYTQGFRIQVYSGSNQEAAEKAKETVYRIDPNFEPEVLYLTPIFKVKVGNYYDRLEAQAALSKLKQTFPQALLVPEKVSIK